MEQISGWLFLTTTAIMALSSVYGACPAGQTTFWCSWTGRTITDTAEAIDNTGLTLDQCRQGCLNRGGCQSVAFVANPAACRYYTQTEGQFSTQVLASTSIHWYVCGTNTCPGASTATTTTSTTSTTASTTATTTNNNQGGGTTTTTTTTTTPQPESSAEPESSPEPEPEGEAEITPEQFWRWLRDEPVWMALIGMGIFTLLLFITIIVLLCRLGRQK